MPTAVPLAISASEVFSNGKLTEKQAKLRQAGLFENAPPPGGHSSQSEQRYLTVPRSNADELEKD